MTFRVGLAAPAVMVGMMLSLGASASGRPSLAPWCALIADENRLDCDYDGLRQCLKTVAGVGGLCVRNPWLGSNSRTLVH